MNCLVRLAKLVFSLLKQEKWKKQPRIIFCWILIIIWDLKNINMYEMFGFDLIILRINEFDFVMIGNGSRGAGLSEFMVKWRWFGLLWGFDVGFYLFDYELDFIYFSA